MSCNATETQIQTLKSTRRARATRARSNMADAADEPTLKEFPEFPGEPMSKRCGATRAKDATTTADGAMDGAMAR